MRHFLCGLAWVVRWFASITMAVLVAAVVGVLAFAVIESLYRIGLYRWLDEVFSFLGVMACFLGVIGFVAWAFWYGERCKEKSAFQRLPRHG